MPNNILQVSVPWGDLTFRSSEFTNSPKGFFCPPSHPQDTHLQELTLSSFLCCPWGPRSYRASGCDFTLACSQLLGQSTEKLLRATVRRGQGAQHSQLVDGVLRDDRVGGEVGIMGPPRLQVQARAPSSRGPTCSGSWGRLRARHPHPGPRPARHEALAADRTGSAGSAGSGGRAGPAGSRRDSRRSRGARPRTPSGRAPPAAHPNSRPGRGGAGLSAPAGRSRKSRRSGPPRPAPEAHRTRRISRRPDLRARS